MRLHLKLNWGKFGFWEGERFNLGVEAAIGSTESEWAILLLLQKRVEEIVGGDETQSYPNQKAPGVSNDESTIDASNCIHWKELRGRKERIVFFFFDQDGKT